MGSSWETSKIMVATPAVERERENDGRCGDGLCVEVAQEEQYSVFCFVLGRI
jgi:hypothetical protein